MGRFAPARRRRSLAAVNTPEPNPSAYPGIPRWVIVSGIIVAVLLVLLGVVMFTGLGGHHGPGRHMAMGMAIALGVQQP